MSSLMFSESSKEIKPERAIAESSWPHHFASACASATNSTPPPNVGDMPLVLETTPIEGTLPVICLITCRQALSHSHHNCDRRTAHVAQRGGLLDCQASKGAIHRLDCAHHCGWHNFIPWRLRVRPWYNPRPPAVTIAGGIALVVGRRLRRALNSAAALAAAQEQASGQVTIEDVDDQRRDGTEPGGLLSIDFIV